MSEVEKKPNVEAEGKEEKILVEVEGAEKPKEAEKSQRNQEVPESVQKRINAITRKFKEEREARIRERQEYERQVIEARRQTQEVQKQSTQATQQGYGALEKQLKEKIELAKQALKVAHETGDTAKVVEASMSLADSQSELKLLAYTRPQEQPVQQQSQQVQQQQRQQAQPQYDPKAVAWAEDKTWFGKDRILTAAAFAINEDLLQDGFDPSEDEFYSELDTRLAKEFPHKFKAEDEGEEETPKPQKTQRSSPVAGVSRTPEGKTKVRLTQGQIKAAKVFGLTPEAYAAQLVAVEQAGDDYTTIQVTRGGK